MSSVCKCVLGQLHGGFDEGIELVRNFPAVKQHLETPHRNSYDYLAEHYGFDHSESVEYEDLLTAWVLEILKRREPAGGAS